MLAGCGGRELLRTHGARSPARRLPSPDRATRSSPRAGAGCFGSRSTRCRWFGNPLVGAPLGHAEVGEVKACEPAAFLPQVAGSHASELSVRDFILERSHLHSARKGMPPALSSRLSTPSQRHATISIAH